MVSHQHKGLHDLHDLSDLGNISAIDISKLNEEDRFRVEHYKMHEKHRGHEKMHLEMVVIMLVVLIFMQILIFHWKKKHQKSYEQLTLVGMWLVPFFICLKFLWLRFILIWIFFTLVTSYIIFLSTRQPIHGSTPRLVYRWFLWIYKISYLLGILGYIAIMLTLFGVNLLLLIPPQVAMDIGLLLIFYGLYYGVVGRDFAEVCSDKMASKIGYYTSSGLPERQLEADVCGICGNYLHSKRFSRQFYLSDRQNLEVEEEEEEEDLEGSNRDEKTYKLNCNHLFHEFCIRGWCIVGKKQTCPYCREKVDLKKMFPSPWERPHVMYGNLLDWLRYLVAWQPIIILIIQAINWILGLE